PGKPDETQTFFSQAPTSDLLGMIWRLRTKPPALGQVEVALVLDGLALWQVTASTVALADPVPEGQGARALKVEGKLLPIGYQGPAGRAGAARGCRRFACRRRSDSPTRATAAARARRPALAARPGTSAAGTPGAAASARALGTPPRPRPSRSPDPRS